MERTDSPWASIDPTQLQRIIDPTQARIVSNPRRCRFLEPFLGRERSVTQAAHEIECDPNTMLYRVRRMLAVGLLHVVDTQARAGRPVNIYRSTRDGYFVPNEIMPYDDLRHRVRSQGQQLAEDLINSYTAVLFNGDNGGRVLARDKLGQIWSTDLPPARNTRGEPVLMIDARLDLTAEEASRIRQLLTDVLAVGRQAASDSALRHGTTTYVLSCALLPLEASPRDH